MSEPAERLVTGPRGVQGEPGEQGKRGLRGLSRLQGRAVVVLFLVAALWSVGNSFWTASEVHAIQAERAARHIQGQMFERKLCTSLASLAALQPPAGTPVGNPSRAYLQDQHAVLAELGPDAGCAGSTSAR